MPTSAHTSSSHSASLGEKTKATAAATAPTTIDPPMCPVIISRAFARTRSRFSGASRGVTEDFSTP